MGVSECRRMVHFVFNLKGTSKNYGFWPETRRKKFLNRSLHWVNEDLKISDNAVSGQKTSF